MKKFQNLLSCTLLPWLLAAFFASGAFHFWKRDLKLLDLPKTHDSTLVTLALKPEDHNRTLVLKNFVGTVEIYRKTGTCEFTFAERIETVYKDGETGLKIEFPQYNDIALIRIAGTDVEGTGSSPRFSAR